MHKNSQTNCDLSFQKPTTNKLIKELIALWTCLSSSKSKFILVILTLPPAFYIYWSAGSWWHSMEARTSWKNQNSNQVSWSVFMVNWIPTNYTINLILKFLDYEQQIKKKRICRENLTPHVLACLSIIYYLLYTYLKVTCRAWINVPLTYYIWLMP